MTHDSHTSARVMCLSAQGEQELAGRPVLWQPWQRQAERQKRTARKPSSSLFPAGSLSTCLLRVSACLAACVSGEQQQHLGHKRVT
eukprot:881432-Pelagomonas_calceolata.AAC.2